MRILVLNADYPRFLAWFYRRQAGLENTSYTTQMAARNASLFGVADFYSKNFAALGHPAAEIHVNNPWLQAAWAREHGMAFEPPPTTVKAVRALGVRCEVNHRAFEPSVLQALLETPGLEVDVSFVGTVSVDHRQRIALREAVAARKNLKLWGNLPQALPASSPLHR